MNIIISIFSAAVAIFCIAAVFSTSLRTQRLAKLTLTRRTWALTAIWFLFGAALMEQERRTDFQNTASYGRLQQSRNVAAALSVLAISSYAWDMHRRRRSPHEHAA
jgi:hypothetical protein